MTEQKRYFKSLHLCLLFLAIIPVTKVVTLPSFLSGKAGTSLWISALITFALDVALILVMGIACEKSNGTFFERLEFTFGKKVSKIIAGVFALFFILKSLLFVLGEKHFIENTFYEESVLSYIFYPFFIILLYLCVKGLKIYERLSFVLCFLTVIGLIMIFLLSFKEARISNLLPINKDVKSIINGSYQSLLYCGEGVYLLFFIGRHAKDKKVALPLTICSIVAYTLVIAFLALFYAVYSNISITQIFAISQISHYSLVIDSIGRLDTFAVFMIDFTRLFAICLPIVLSMECIRFIVGAKTKTTVIISSSLALLVLLFVNFFNNQTTFIINFFNKFFSYFFILMTYVLPPFVFLLKEKK